jgi:hypothetical protein
MVESGIPALAGWESFYVIIGTSAAALIGLQFVVIALGADARTIGGEAAVNAFATPTIVHFGTVLLIAGFITMPWSSIAALAIAMGVAAAIGLGYMTMVVRQAHAQTEYQPVFEDWLFHAVLPFAAHIILFVSAIALPGLTHGALFGVGAAALLFMFIAIHNAWDAAAYMAMAARRRNAEAAGEVSPQAPAPQKPADGSSQSG